MAANDRDSRFLRSEINSLNGRLNKFNQENDDLLQRLSELKVERDRREKEFDSETAKLHEKIRNLEEDKFDLLRQIRDRRDANELMQKGFKSEESHRRQIENMRQEHARRENELLHRMESLKNERDVEESRWKKEVEQLKMTVQSKLNIIDELRLENEQMMRRTTSDEAEMRLREENNQLKKMLDVERRLLTEARHENEELRSNSGGKNDEVKRKIDELAQRLRYKEDLLDEANRELKKLIEDRRNDAIHDEKAQILRKELNRLDETVREKDRLLEDALTELTKLRRTVNQSTSETHVCDRSTRLERELDRLSVTLKSKEELLSVVQMEKRQLQTKVEELQETRGMMSERDRLENSIRTKERVIDELVAKNKELTSLNDRLQKDLKETRSFLKNTSDTNQELIEKSLQLESTLVKTIAEKEETRPEKLSPYLKKLLMEQESNIFDLQRQVTTLRASVANQPKESKSKPDPPTIYGSNSEILSPKPKDHSKLDESILKELKQAKMNLDFSRQRILKLENYLDSMYNGTGELETPSLLRRIGNRSVTNGFSSRSVIALPDIVEYDDLRDDGRILRAGRKYASKVKTRPDWNNSSNVRPA